MRFFRINREQSRNSAFHKLCELLLLPWLRKDWRTARPAFGFICFGLVFAAGYPSVQARAAAKPAPASETEIRKGLSGTWEVELPPKWAPVNKAFLKIAQSGSIRVIALASVATVPARAELTCSWHLEGLAITVKVTQSDLPNIVGQSATERILFLSSTVLVIQDEDSTLRLHRCILPDSLPPKLNGPLIILTNTTEVAVSAPRPPYPSEARQRDIRGNGIFRLHVDLHNGVVKRVETERSTGNALLDRAAMTGLQKWYFKAPLLRQIQQKQDAGNTSGELVFRVPVIFSH